MNWEVWRLLTSKHIRVSLEEMRRSWTILDFLDAHMLADSFEAAEAEAQASGKKD